VPASEARVNPSGPNPPPPHPPSPHKQRVYAQRQQARQAMLTRRARGRGAGYLRRHWRGDLPLAAAVIASGALVWGAVQLVAFASRHVPMTDYPEAASLLLVAEIALLTAGAVWWGMGVQRAAFRHVELGGSLLVALLTGAVGVGAFFWAGAFWYQSARHVMPDVWATLAGTAPPAVVQVDAAAGVVRLKGDLEFGSMRALRAALDAHPGIRIVQLESRGGRVAEGLALGALLRDRGVDTLVTGECSSACVTAFAGGARRLIAPQAKIGLHSAGGKGVSAAAVASANRASDEFIAQRGVDWRVLEKGAAVANESIWFPEPWLLLASGLATDYAGAAR
jgi:hypothetical protein